MSSREKLTMLIIVIVLAISVGVYLKSQDPIPAGRSGSWEELNRFIDNIDQKAGGLASSLSVSSYILEKAQAGLSKDFALTEHVDKERSDEHISAPVTEISPEQLGLNYAGYLNAGGKLLAVINGVGYEPGDKITIKAARVRASSRTGETSEPQAVENGIYVVQNISVNGVLMAHEKSGRRILVPLVEMDLTTSQ